MHSTEQKLAEVQKIIDNTRGWLSTFGQGSKSPWPQHEIDIKTTRLEVMKALKVDLERAIEKKRNASA